MSHKRHKYPKQYKCCNDTITGCGLLCCKKFDKFAEEDILQTDEKDAENHFIWEKTVDSTVKSINGNWSWASAGLLAAACQAIIVFNEDGLSTVVKNWIYFFLIFAVGVLVALIEHSLESPERIAKELELKVPKKKAALGDKQAMANEKDMIQKAETVHLAKDKETAMSRILKFVQIEGNILFENMENLFIAIVSNVIALAFNDAANSTFEEILKDSKASGTAVITAQWIYVIVLVLFNCFGAIKLGAYIDECDIKMFDDMKANGVENSKTALLRYSTLKRIFKLITHCMSLVVAWALRDAMKTSILSLYGGSGSENTVSALWVYTIVATLLVTYSNTLCERYYLLYPKDGSVGMQFDTAERKLIGDILWKNAQAVVGIAWYDVLVESPEKLSDAALEKHRIWILWLEAVGFMILSGVLSGYWTMAKMKFKTKQKGPVVALFESFENWFDPNHVIDEGKKKKEEDEDDNGKEKVNKHVRESFFLEYFGQFIDVLIYAFGFASGWLISAAVKAMMVKSYEGIYNPDQVTDISKDVIWSMWLAFFICLIVSALIMTYLSRVVTGIRDKKHQIFDKWRSQLEEKDKIIDRELQAMEKDNDGQANIIPKEESGNDENDEHKSLKEIEMHL